jgi:two-component system, OmpR family, KDP operon response regulator KdpE
VTRHDSVRQLVLIVEDDRPVQSFIATTLKAHGYRTEIAESGAHGLSLTYSLVPDVVLLDLGLPDIDGMEVLRRIRENLELPVIVVSARGNERSKVDALDEGADDYLSKPFGTGELLARIRVSLRHSARLRAADRAHIDDVRTVGPLTFDGEKRIVSSHGKRVHLTPIEYRLLEELVANAGKVLTHRHLVLRVWGPNHHVDPHNVRVFMATLRRKLESDPNQPQLILTEVGVGYRLREEW